MGEHSISDETETVVEDVPPEKVIIHKSYDKIKQLNDIALIRLSRTIELLKNRKNVNTVCLPVEESQRVENLSGEGSTLQIAGWGMTENSRSSDVLMTAQIPYLPQEECVDKYDDLRRKNKAMKTIIGNSQMCAGGTSIVDA